MPPADSSPALCQALALGLLQGPTELLPVSSSAHTTLLPWLAGWSYRELSGAQRKSFEVVLHAGAGLALALVRGPGLRRDARPILRRPVGTLALAVGVPAAAGLALRGPIERRLGGPSSIAAGLVSGALAMAAAEHRPQRPGRRAGPADGAALGLAQAAALMPGVSRSGATLACARGLGFNRADSEALSWAVGLPVLLGASALESAELMRPGRRGERRALLTGGAAAFLSTLLAGRVLASRSPGTRLLPFSVYRCLLAAVVVRRLRRSQ